MEISAYSLLCAKCHSLVSDRSYSSFANGPLVGGFPDNFDFKIPRNRRTNAIVLSSRFQFENRLRSMTGSLVVMWCSTLTRSSSSVAGMDVFCCGHSDSRSYRDAGPSSHRLLSPKSGFLVHFVASSATLSFVGTHLQSAMLVVSMISPIRYATNFIISLIWPDAWQHRSRVGPNEAVRNVNILVFDNGIHYPG